MTRSGQSELAEPIAIRPTSETGESIFKSSTADKSRQIMGYPQDFAFPKFLKMIDLSLNLKIVYHFEANEKVKYLK